MKQIKISIAVVLALAASHCSKQSDPNPKEDMIQNLTQHIWITESVHNDVDGDLTAEYADFAIAFENRLGANFDGDYYVAHGGQAFPEIFGQWRFSMDLERLILANGREMDVTISETTLTFVFTVPSAGGRVKGISGQFTFRLKKK